MKLKLDELRLQSFITTVTAKNNLHGGIATAPISTHNHTDGEDCFWQTDEPCCSTGEASVNAPCDTQTGQVKM